MPHEGYVDPVTNDGPGLHSSITISELTERVTRAIVASNFNSAPSVARNRGQGNAQNSTDPYQSPMGLRGSRHLNCLGYTRCQDPRALSRPIPKLPWLCPTPGSVSSISPDP